MIEHFDRRWTKEHYLALDVFDQIVGHRRRRVSNYMSSTLLERSSAIEVSR